MVDLTGIVAEERVEIGPFNTEVGQDLEGELELPVIDLGLFLGRALVAQVELDQRRGRLFSRALDWERSRNTCARSQRERTP